MTWGENANINNISRSKPVAQIGSDGEIIAIYGSINKAGKAIETTASNISQSIRRECMANGFYWRYAS